MSTSSVGPQLRKIRTELHPKDGKRCQKLFLYTKPHAQYQMEMKSEQL